MFRIRWGGIAATPTAIVALALLAGVSPGPAAAGIGDYDTTYNGDGIARRDLGSDHDMVLDIHVTPTGRTYVLAFAYDIVDGFQGNERYVIARLTSNGGLDGSFSGDGKAVIPLADFDALGYGPSSIFVDEAARRIYLGGAQVYNTDGNYTRFAVVRTSYSGNLDEGFGTDGVATVDPPPSDGIPFDYGNHVTHLAVQPDGTVVAVGLRDSYSAGAKVAVARFSAAGEPDAGFGTGGLLVTVGQAFEYPLGMALTAAGDVVVIAKGGEDDASTMQLVVARIDSTGAPEASSHYVDDVGHVHAALGPRLADDGSITVAGSSTIPGGDGFPNRNFIVRYTAAGERDDTYGTGGLYAEDNGEDMVFLNTPGALHPSGKIFYAYSAQDADGDDDVYDVYVRRMVGSPDLALAGAELASDGGGGGGLPPSLVALLALGVLVRGRRA